MSTSRTTCVVAPRRLSRLFFTSKFPKPARQSVGDRTADVPLTMSFWALALHKRGNSKNGGTRRGTRGDEHGRGGFYDCEARRYRRFRVPHAPILQCTLLVCPLLFDCPAPSRLFSPCIWLALDSFPISSPATSVLLLPSWSAFFSLYPRGGAAKHRQTDRWIILSTTRALLDVNPSHVQD